MKKLISTFLLSTLSTIVLTQQAFADRPAAEDSSVTENVAPEPATETNAPQETPSSVDIIMQQEQRGDVVTLPPKEMQAGETLQIKLMDSPRRGMSMDKVRNELGQPNTVSEAVGQPPITSWTYSDRIVYFEYSTVLHVVAR